MVAFRLPIINVSGNENEASWWSDQIIEVSSRAEIGHLTP